MKKKYDLSAIVGKYTNKDGDEKNRYVTCGALFERDDGSISIKIESLPAGNLWNGWLNCYEPKPRNDISGDPIPTPAAGKTQAAGAPPRRAPPQDFEDEIPFAPHQNFIGA